MLDAQPENGAPTKVNLTPAQQEQLPHSQEVDHRVFPGRDSATHVGGVNTSKKGSVSKSKKKKTKKPRRP